MPVLVLLRHSQSEWNLADRFTGWRDIPLTSLGHRASGHAGRLLAASGFVFDEVHISLLRRTRQTAVALLAAMGAPTLPLHATWRLNERHYGALQGLHKQEIFATWGEAPARAWWRGFADRPPPLSIDDPQHPRFDSRYAAVPVHLLPSTESLADCLHRTLPYWQRSIAPALSAGRRPLVISHGNTMRALIMWLDRLSPERTEALEVPAGVPLVYRFASDLTVLGREWLDSSVPPR